MFKKLWLEKWLATLLITCKTFDTLYSTNTDTWNLFHQYAIIIMEWSVGWSVGTCSQKHKSVPIWTQWCYLRPHEPGFMAYGWTSFRLWKAGLWCWTLDNPWPLSLRGWLLKDGGQLWHQLGQFGALNQLPQHNPIQRRGQSIQCSLSLIITYTALKEITVLQPSKWSLLMANTVIAKKCNLRWKIVLHRSD